MTKVLSVAQTATVAHSFRSPEYRDLYRLATRAGWVPAMTGKQHVSLRSPGGAVVVLSMTAYGGTLKQKRAEFRRAGLIV